jgi:alanyl-tRNA synthetase
VNMDDPMLTKIWNLVFTHFSTGEMHPLPKTHVDSGMDFERLVSVLQDQPSNYDTDVFAGILEAIVKVTGCESLSGLVGEEDATKKDLSLPLCAYHIRTLAFAVADGAMPSAEGRGCVLCRILRSPARYDYHYVVAESAFFCGHNLGGYRYFVRRIPRPSGAASARCFCYPARGKDLRSDHAIWIEEL